MTEKEFSKLRRQELLQLLLTQGEEAAETERELKETREQLKELEANYEVLRKRLDQKDEKIQGLKEQMNGEYEHLKERLNQKDKTIQELKEKLESERAERRVYLEEAGSIAEACLRLNGVFEAAQKAADQYLYNIKQIKEEQETEDAFDMFWKWKGAAGGFQGFGKSNSDTNSGEADGTTGKGRSSFWF